MALQWKLVIDCADPHRQAAFWAEALGYTVEDHSELIRRLLGFQTIGQDDITEVGGRRAFRALAAVRHPEDPVDPQSDTGLGRRLLFQLVPEAKSVKNRLHIDLHVGPDGKDTETARLVELGATVLREVDDRGSRHVTMADPEGNEFDVQ